MQFHALAGIGPVRVDLSIKTVKTLPEGLPAILANAYKVARDGQVQKANPVWLEKTVGVLDIGGATSDRLVFGPGLDLLADDCLTIDLGINAALEASGG